MTLPAQNACLGGPGLLDPRRAGALRKPWVPYSAMEKIITIIIHVGPLLPIMLLREQNSWSHKFEHWVANRKTDVRRDLIGKEKNNSLIPRKSPEWVATWSLHSEPIINKQSTIIVQMFSGQLS